MAVERDCARRGGERQSKREFLRSTWEVWGVLCEESI